MNMISTGAFLPETDASTKQNELVKKLTAAWEKKNSKTARAGGASLMALSLAACGGEDNTPFSAADVSAAEAAATTAALTGADGTVYASVDAAVTSNDTAIADAARAEGVASVDITSDNTEVMMSQADYDAAIAAADDAVQAALDALQASYDAITAEPSATALTSTAAETLIGSPLSNTFTAATATDDATDSIIDATTTDADVLNWTLTANPAALATIRNIETINFVTQTSADLTYDMANTVGTTAVTVVREDYLSGRLDGTGTFDIDNAVGTATYSFGAQVDDGEVNFNATGSAGTSIAASADMDTLLVTNVAEEGVSITSSNADGLALTVDGLGDTTSAGAGNDAVTLTVAGDSSILLDGVASGGDVVELVTLSATAEATVDLTGAVEEITVTGDQNITITASAAELTGEKLTDSGTGTITISADAAGALDLSSMTGVDVVDLDADFANNTVTVNSGVSVSTNNAQGANPLTVAAAVTTAAAVLVNDVTFVAADNEVATTGITMNDLVFTNFATVGLDGTAEDISGVDLTAGTAAVTISGNNDVTFTGTTTAGSVTNAGTGAVTLTMSAANSTITLGSGADSITSANTGAGILTVNAGDGANTLDINAVASGSSFATGAGVDTVSVDTTNSLSVVTGAGNDTITLVKAADLNLNGEAGTDTLVVDGAGDLDVSSTSSFALAGIEKVSLADGLAVSVAQFADFAGVELAGTAAKVLTVGDITTTTAQTVDASSLVIKVGTTSTTALNGGTKADTITGSDAVDVIATAAGNDVISGGAGADQITAGTGTDVISGGSGADVFNFADADSVGTAAAYDTITDFETGSDTIDFAGAAGSALNYFEHTADVADYDAAVAAADAKLDGTFDYFFATDGTDGWLFYDADGAAVSGAAFDGVVALTGIDESEIAFGDIIA